MIVNVVINMHFLLPIIDIEVVMVVSGHDYVILEDDDIYKKGNKFKSFHHKASQPIS